MAQGTWRSFHGVHGGTYFNRIEDLNGRGDYGRGHRTSVGLEGEMTLAHVKDNGV